MQANDATTITTARAYTNTANTFLQSYSYPKTGGTISGDVAITGNLVINGTYTTVNTTTITTTDSLIKLANNNIAGDTLDIGFYGQSNTGSSVTYHGLVRQAAGNFFLFKGLPTDPSSNVLPAGSVTATNTATIRANVTGGMVFALANAISYGDGGTGSTSYTTGQVLVAGATGLQSLANVTSYSATGSSTAIPVITTDVYGRVTSLSTASISTSLSVYARCSNGLLNGSTSVSLGSQILTITGNTDSVIQVNTNNQTVYVNAMPSGVTAGTYGNASCHPTLTVDTYGRITSVTNTAITIASSSVTGLATSATTDTSNASNISSGTLSSSRLPTSGVTVGAYGNTTSIPTITVDTYGRITSVSNNAISTSILLAAGSGSGTVSGGGTLSICGGTGITTSVTGSTYTVINAGVTCLTGTANQVSVSASTGSVTLSLPQSINTTNSPTFAGLTVGSLSGVLKATAGVLSVATSSTDYAPATSGSAILKGNGSGGFSSATSGSDYAPATSGSSILKGSGSGGFNSAGCSDLNSTFGSQTANTVYAAPNGSAGNPSFRALVAGDIPTLNQNTTGTAAGLSATLVATSGGTGQSSYTVGDILYASSTTALSKLSTTTSGYVLTSQGAGAAPVWAASSSGGTSSTFVISNTTASTSTTTGALQVCGGAGIVGALFVGGDVTSLSDCTVKENIQTITNALSKTLALRGVTYTRKETQEESLGVIAQEVDQIIPEVVSTSEEGLKSVSYGNMVGLLIEAIKEQQKQIDELKSKLNGI